MGQGHDQSGSQRADGTVTTVDITKIVIYNNNNTESCWGIKVKFHGSTRNRKVGVPTSISPLSSEGLGKSSSTM